MRNFVVLFIVLILVLFLSLISGPAIASSNEIQADLERSSNFAEARAFGRAVRDGKLEERTRKAIENIIKASTAELRKHKAKKLADRIEDEYRTIYSSRALGDHQGVQWLLKIHAEIEFVLGETICRALRTHDLWVLGMTIGVVFRCQDNVDENEYKLHFVPLAGVISYWVSAGACTGATLGMGGVSFLCGFVGLGVEMLTTRFIAPPLSRPCWKQACL